MSDPHAKPESGASGSHVFQVNLGGIIELLSRHIYSGPHVYLRELLQNAADAITARQRLAASLVGEITVELIEDQATGISTLVLQDNGVGLTEEEVHQFLATIGSSSKRSDLESQRNDYLGQFGIGLLAGFMVSDEIVLLTRSAQAGSPRLEWKGRIDGTYSLRAMAASEAPPGTQVFLRARSPKQEHFAREYVGFHLRNFGGFLPHHIQFTCGGWNEYLNESYVPWDKPLNSPDWQTETLAFGERLFKTQFLDCFPLAAPKAGVRGVAFVLAASPGLAVRRSDRVYLKGMLLSDHADGLFPEWAFFVRSVVNATGLNPNASRESLQEDARLTDARQELGDCLRRYLLDLARQNRERLERLIALHYRAIKMLAVDDDEFYRLFIDWLPFETSQGQLTMGRIRAGVREIQFVPHLDTFRQLAPVAAAQSLCLINAGYVCDVDLIERLPEVFPGLSVRKLEPDDFLDTLREIPLADQEAVLPRLEQVSGILSRFECKVELKAFLPGELPALYSLSEEARFQRDLERSKERSAPLWQGLLGGVERRSAHKARGSLCLNWNNPLIQRLLSLPDTDLLKRGVELLYVQALLQGHFPLGLAEHKVLGDGLAGLLDLALRART